MSHIPMHVTWNLLSELGNSTWLLPSVTLMALTGSIGHWLPWPAVLRWLGSIAVTAVFVLISKIAFMGWGIGSTALDFTGFSGHAAMSAAIYPVLLAWISPGPRGHPVPHLSGMLAGVMLTLLISASRISLHAHSISEVVSGFALGLGAAMFALYFPVSPIRRGSAAVLLIIGLATGLTVRMAPMPSSHQIVGELARRLSGNEHIHQRSHLFR